jgi:hypothetical protein
MLDETPPERSTPELTMALINRLIVVLPFPGDWTARHASIAPDVKAELPLAFKHFVNDDDRHYVLILPTHTCLLRGCGCMLFEIRVLLHTISADHVREHH